MRNWAFGLNGPDQIGLGPEWNKESSRCDGIFFAVEILRGSLLEVGMESGGTPFLHLFFCSGVYLEYKVVNLYGRCDIFLVFWRLGKKQQDVSLFQRFWTPQKRVDPET